MADGGADLATLTIGPSRDMSPTAVVGSNMASSGRSSVAAADVSMEPVAPRCATAANIHDSPAPGVVSAYHASVVTANSQWSSAHNDVAVAAAAVYNNSYFGAGHQAAPPVFSQRPQRPLHDIVSSMQGSFHFLQESQIDLESLYFSRSMLFSLIHFVHF